MSGSGRSSEKETATHSSILAWEIPRTEETDGLQSMGSQSWTRLSNNKREVQMSSFLENFSIHALSLNQYLHQS